MGLALSVGMLADLKENDPEGYSEATKSYENLSILLELHGLQRHQEPLEIEPWDAEMFGYSGLHHLRRLAAHVDSGLQLPPPGDENSASDVVLESYFDNVTGKSTSLFKSLFGKKKTFRREFDHLIVHSDAEGFYVPQEFAEVLFASDDVKIPGDMVGSVPRLLDECERLARVLDIPKQLTKDADELWEAADTQGEGTMVWQRFGIESFTCVALMEACRQSISTGALLEFC